jgi:hypothetical protein
MTGKNLKKDKDEEEATPMMHEILVSTIYNKVIFLHANPDQGKIHIFELDPQFTYKYNHVITYQPKHQVKLQVIDNLLVVHNINQKSSQMYDFKIQDYTSPLTRDNLDCNMQYA